MSGVESYRDAAARSVLRGPHSDSPAAAAQVAVRDCSEVPDAIAAWVCQTSPLLVIGASARAAVHSARRSGWRDLVAVDLFGDGDLSSACVAQPVRALDGRLAALRLVRAARCWIYTGALENRPQLVARISRRVTLLGNPPAVLRRVRDPARLAAVLQAAGLPSTEVIQRPDARLGQSTWLRKPRASSAGRGIRQIEATEATDAIGISADWVYQRYVPGLACAGVFLAAAGQARLLGVTQQLIGREHACFGARGFQYVGSIGPLPLTPTQQQHWQQIGECLSAAFGLRGLFGVDALESSQGIVPVEVNPRYTASVEVLERSLHWPTIAWHVVACRTRCLPPPARPPDAVRCSGKAIVHAVESCRWTGGEDASGGECDAGDAWPTLADVPPHGTCFRPGDPIVTVLAQGTAPADVLEQLRDRAAKVRARYLMTLDPGQNAGRLT